MQQLSGNMFHLHQSPTDPAFVQNPYPFYDRARQHGPLAYWSDYNMPAAFGYDAVHTLLRDRRFGRETPPENTLPAPAYLARWLNVERHSMLDAEPPRHTRLRALVLRAFTTRRIAGLAGQIEDLCNRLINAFPGHTFDLLAAYCTQVPVITIARLLGVPESMTPQLLIWSHQMVAMYQASRTAETELAAERAATEFTDFLREHVKMRRTSPADDLITSLIAAEEEGTRLSTDELIGTCILLLNAGHEATVHAMGNGIKAILQTETPASHLMPDRIGATVEEILRYDPPLHMFTRHVYAPVTLFGHSFQRGDQVALMLAAANRDPARWADASVFDSTRTQHANASFGGGLHFCVGAPLARLEMQIALPLLFARCPAMSLAGTPRYADTYHFRGLERLDVTI